MPDHSCTALASLPLLTLPLPFPSLPLPPPHTAALSSYRDDDVDLVQSAAILRYLGRKHGLYGAAGDILEATRIDQLLDGELAHALGMLWCGVSMRLISVPWARLLCESVAAVRAPGPGLHASHAECGRGKNARPAPRPACQQCKQ